MKIYILRHEERTIDCTFFAPLTKKGLENSIKLSNYLLPLNIDEIYCSPFIRTLQTITPYINKTHKKLKLEYGLIEIKHESIISPKSHNVELPDYLTEFFNYDNNYTTLINTNQIKYPENTNDLKNRVYFFLRHLLIQYHKTNKNILLVTHQGICSIILSILKNHNLDNQSNTKNL
jgi:broad specificity phosphatase PhoE